MRPQTESYLVPWRLPSWELCDFSICMGSCFYPMTHGNESPGVGKSRISQHPFLYWFWQWSWIKNGNSSVVSLSLIDMIMLVIGGSHRHICTNASCFTAYWHLFDPNTYAFLLGEFNKFEFEKCLVKTSFTSIQIFALFHQNRPPSPHDIMFCKSKQRHVEPFSFISCRNTLHGKKPRTSWPRWSPFAWKKIGVLSKSGK